MRANFRAPSPSSARPILSWPSPGPLWTGKWQYLSIDSLKNPGKILFEIDQQLLKERIVIKNYLIRSKEDKKLFLNLNSDLLHQIFERKKKAEAYLKLYSQKPEELICYFNEDLLKNKERLIRKFY